MLPSLPSLTLAAPSNATSAASAGPVTVAPTIGFGNLSLGGAGSGLRLPSSGSRVAPSPLVRAGAASQLAASPVTLALGALALFLLVRR